MAAFTVMTSGGGRQIPVILAGDLNDEADAATTQIINGPTGSEIGTDGFSRPDRGDGNRMFNLSPRNPRTSPVHTIYRGRRELIDHIFVSHFLAANGHTVTVDTLTARPGLLSITEDPTTLVGTPGSDHAAVTFNW